MKVIIFQSGSFTLFEINKMMSVQDYRTAIDCFLGKAVIFSFISKKQEVLNNARRKQNNSKFKSIRGIDTSKPYQNNNNNLVTNLY